MWPRDSIMWHRLALETCLVKGYGVQARRPQGAKVLGFGPMWRATHCGRSSRNRGYPVLSAAQELQGEGQEAQTASFTQTVMKEEDETPEPHKPQRSAERGRRPCCSLASVSRPFLVPGR